MPRTERPVIGWDIGGAHVKACLQQGGQVQDVAQWPCPLWLGLDRLDAALQAAQARWPGELPRARHAVTMTGEMADLFEDREDGVRRIAQELARTLGAHEALHFFAGDAGWCRDTGVPQCWEAIASANWLATARHAMLGFDTGVLVDIGSTTSDFIVFGAGRVKTAARSDTQRLASGELLYHGVVRTPLCAVAQRIDWRGAPHHVMNEFFATSADVYRLTGELDPAHDQHDSADHAPKSLPATRQRLARMIGLDRRDGTPAEWLEFARAWRAAQLRVLGGELRRVLAAHAVPAAEAVFVGAGCGDFLLPELAAIACGGAPRSAPRLAAYGRDVASVSMEARAGRAAVQGWAQVCAPCVAVAALFEREH